MSNLMRRMGLGGAFAALVSCAGGGRAPQAPGSPLSYQTPEGAGFRFIQNDTLSTPGRVVLDLVGPDAQVCRGVAFILQAGAEVAWTPLAPGRGFLENLAFELGPGAPLMQSAVRGRRLQAVVLQRGPGQGRGLGAPLCRVALASAGALPSGLDIPLRVVAFHVLPMGGAALEDAHCALGALTVP